MIAEPAREPPRPRLLLVYHFFHPDDVVGARLYADLAEAQRDRGWDVTVLTSNRLWRDPAQVLPAAETWRGIRIIRASRPPWTQGAPLSRLANAAWLLAAWLRRAISLPAFDAVIVGTDPAFAAALLPPLRARWPRAAFVNWCFDLYPEAIAASHPVMASAFMPVARRAMRWAYSACDAVVDLGPCMRARLAHYRLEAQAATLVPWALVEGDATDVDPAIRAELFGDARLGLLYSGNLGRAHDFETFLEIARRCRARSGNAIALAFACRGHRSAELRAAVAREGAGNVRIVPFGAESALPERLNAADLHLVSLRPAWSGIVVPSKFFGSLAAGRPVIYAGPRDSDVARWIATHDVGLTVDSGTLDAIVDRLHAIGDDKDHLRAWQRRAAAVYRREFSRERVNDEFTRLLSTIVEQRQARRAEGGRPAVAKPLIRVAPRQPQS